MAYKAERFAKPKNVIGLTKSSLSLNGETYDYKYRDYKR
jgi:hypothetical protein